MTEDDLEQLALTWFQDSGWEYRCGPDIAPDGDAPERADYRQVARHGVVVEVESGGVKRGWAAIVSKMETVQHSLQVWGMRGQRDGR